MRRLMLLAVPLVAVASATAASAAPVRVETRSAAGASVRVVTIDLHDPATVLDIGLAKGAPTANSATETHGDEPFEAMTRRAHAAAVINGTFFSKDAQKRVMGNMVRGGALVKYSPWENAGTTFGLYPGNRPEMVTARAEGKPDWQSHWLSITCGPRLLKDGAPWLHPAEEGFTDSHVLGVAGRSALGYSRDGRWLYWVSFDSAVSLAQEARAMKAIGAWEAMNLDGGASRALAVHGRTVVSAGRALTNVLAVYDAGHPAPRALASTLRPGAAEAQAPAARLVQRLAPGDRLPYAKLSFEHVWRDPVVGVSDGALTFSAASFGEVLAAQPGRPRDFVLRFRAKLASEYWGLFVDATPGRPRLGGVGLEVRRAAPAGVYLKRDGAIVRADQALAVDDAWHRWRIEAKGAWLRVYVDDAPAPIVEGPRGEAGSAIGLSGRGTFADFAIEPFGRPSRPASRPTPAPRAEGEGPSFFEQLGETVRGWAAKWLDQR